MISIDATRLCSAGCSERRQSGWRQPAPRRLFAHRLPLNSNSRQNPRARSLNAEPAALAGCERRSTTVARRLRTAAITNRRPGCPGSVRPAKVKVDLQRATLRRRALTPNAPCDKRQARGQRYAGERSGGLRERCAMTRSSVLCGLLAFSGLTAPDGLAPNLALCRCRPTPALRIASAPCRSASSERGLLRSSLITAHRSVAGDRQHAGHARTASPWPLHPGWVAWLTNPGMDLHVGIVSTDVGSWVAADQPFAQPAGACDSFAGDDGALQAVSCWERAIRQRLSRPPAPRYVRIVATCRPMGTRFIALEGAASNVPRDRQPASESAGRHRLRPACAAAWSRSASRLHRVFAARSRAPCPRWPSS